jgi:hypothetical protein
MATGFFYKNAASVTASLTNSAGSLIAVLDEVLDIASAGYGGTLGWEKPFEDIPNNRAVYRATTGNRFYVRVDDNYGATALVRMYQTMSDVNTGTDPAPNGNPQSTGWMRVLKANEGGDHHFLAVGDSRYFSLFIRHYHGGSYLQYAPFCFGDFNSFDPLDSYNTILMASAAASNNATYAQYKRTLFDIHTTNAFEQSASYVGSVDNTACQVIASPDGVIKSTSCLMHDPFAVMNNGSRGCKGMAHFGSSPAMVYAPWYIFDFNGASTQSMQYGSAAYGSNGYMRGTLPYLYATPYAPLTGAPGTVDDGASSFGVLTTSLTYELNISLTTGRVHFFRITDDEPGRTF